MKKIKRSSNKKGPVVAKRTIYDGIEFASNLEKYTYIAFKKAGIEIKYEGETFTLIPEFEFKSSSYERQSNGKGEFVDRGNKKVQSLKYTPDFIGNGFIVECKGRANESFPLRYKMFKWFLSKNRPNIVLFKPQNQSDVDNMINIIKEKL